MAVDLTKKFFIGYIDKRRASPPFATEGEVLNWASSTMSSQLNLDKLYIGEVYGTLTRMKPAVELSHLRGHHIVEPELPISETVE